MNLPLTPNSRSYITQFSQPDTIVPDPYNPQDWNRYSYARNNPVRYNDPSGHRPCEDGNCQINPLAYRITYDFGWILKGKNWTGKELQTIFVTGNRIKNYIDNLTNGKGQQWMDAYLSGTNIVHSPGYLPQNQNLTLPGWIPRSGGTNTVNLFPGWLNQDGGGRWLVHEMGHIWDMNTAWGVGVTGAHGGVADDLNTAVGGNIANSIFRSRFLNGSGAKSIPSDAQYARGYANNSTADYLAETFTFQIYPAFNPGGAGSESASSWVQAFIILQADELP